jgi:hypothetical protein
LCQALPTPGPGSSKTHRFWGGPLQLNLESLAMQAGHKFCGCSTQAEPIFESRAVLYSISRTKQKLEYPVNFTREPIIETVIMPREGCKLLVRNSKGGGLEEYYVDSIEVVSFGRSFFFRSQERLKSFLVPVSDYEVLEQKETRMSLKNAPPERSIKIGGGREGQVRPPREALPESESYEPQEREHLEPQRPPMDQGRKRDKRRRGRRGGGGHSEGSMQMREQPPLEERYPKPGPSETQGAPFEPAAHIEARSDEHKAPSFISKLFPPPPTLIKDSLSRYKTAEPLEGEAEGQKEEKLEDLFFEPPLSPDKSDSNEEEEPPFEE